MLNKLLKPNNNGYYGEFGGKYIPELLVSPLKEVEFAFDKYSQDPQFIQEFQELLRNFAGRPTPLYQAKSFGKEVGVNSLFFKREDLLHTGAHKINNALGQCLLAKYMGKSRIIAETGAGQHGVATATACANLDLNCVVYMGEVDMDRQSANVKRMRLLGAEVIGVASGQKTLKDAVNQAMRDWSSSYENTHYCLGSALGPHPFPIMVTFFHLCIGEEAKNQLKTINQKIDTVIACVGGGSNAIGIFSGFLDNEEVKLIGVEAGGIDEQPGNHAARFLDQTPGVLHGCFTYLLQTQDGQILPTHSISAGLDYPAIGPMHPYLAQLHKATYANCKDLQALKAFKMLAKKEGIIPALESSHALGYLLEHKAEFAGKNVLVNISGRGDKDLDTLIKNNLI